MKSNYIHLKNPLCHYCLKTVVAGTRRTVLDDNGSLAITAWTCGECGSVNEEIGILSENGQVIPRPNLKKRLACAAVSGRLARPTDLELPSSTCIDIPANCCRLPERDGKSSRVRTHQIQVNVDIR